MLNTIAISSLSTKEPSKLAFHGSPGPSPAEYDDNNSGYSTPCPSLVHSATATDPESDVGDRLAMPESFHPPVPAVTFSTHVENKRHDGTVSLAGGDGSHQDQGPHDANSLKSVFSDDGITVNQGNNCGHGYNGGGNFGGGGDDGREGPESQSPDQPATGADAAGESGGWACPYRKRNPLLFNVRDHRTCSCVPFRTPERLKEHLELWHVPQADHEEQCPARTTGACECTSSGRMGMEVMGKIEETVRRTPQKEPTWEAIYKMLFGGVEPVPKADWEPPIELEEYFSEIKQRLDVLRERVKLETQSLIPGHEDIQVKIWSSMTDIFIFFLEQTMSSCQQRVRGNADISYFGPDYSWSASPAKTENTPSDLLGCGDWSSMSNSEEIVHWDKCPPSSLLLAVRSPSGKREFFCRVDCTTQQLLDFLGIDLPLTGTRKTVDTHGSEQRTSMEVDKPNEAATPDSDLSPMDTSGLSSSTSPASPSQSDDQFTAEEDADSDSSDDEDALADEMISRVCDIVMKYCGGPACATNITDLDAIGQAVGTAVTDFVHELLNDLTTPTTPPQTRQCTGRGNGGPLPTFSAGSSGGGYGGSSGAPGQGGADLRGQGTPGSGQGSQGFGGDGPSQPGPGGLAQQQQGMETPAEPPYSCPYRKRNPQRFNLSDKKYKQCAVTGWKTFDKLKRHLREKHNPSPIECSRCKQCFPDDEARNEHNRSQPPCAFRDTAPTEGVDPDDGMSAHVVHRLNARTGKDRIQSWDVLWRLLFPQEPHIPSPYFEPPEETICSKIRKRFNDALPALELALEERLSDFTLDVRNVIMEVVRNHEHRVLTDVETSLQPKLGSKRRSTSPEDQGASAKRPRMSPIHPSVPPPLLQHSALPQQYQTVQHQATDQSWIDMSGPSNSQPQPLNAENAMFIQPQHGRDMMSGSQPTSPGNFPVPEGAYHDLGYTGAWNSSATVAPGVLSAVTDQFSFDNNSSYPPLEGYQHVPSNYNTDVDEDTGSYTVLGGPRYGA
ncbi:hypothetical protein QBC47DRAFT_391995 [Echria macrotheca]|uniref:C2H2-type domain-containing protein n=1 Tax=Echria macrotheca TaxID=438768 RepID=A0AAJ0B672_9PEZI|nr:hypothetical protein QBC47DRAFT_391995 [Echria macrotheca]